MVNETAVIDCSALIRAFTDDSSIGHRLRVRLREVHNPVAPTLLDYELMSALLGMIRGGKITSAQASKAIADYQALEVDRHETLRLWERVRDLNHNLSAYDAQYVALAEFLALPLITCDARIQRSGAAKCPVEVFD